MTTEQSTSELTGTPSKLNRFDKFAEPDSPAGRFVRFTGRFATKITECLTLPQQPTQSETIRARAQLSQDLEAINRGDYDQPAYESPSGPDTTA